MIPEDLISRIAAAYEISIEDIHGRSHRPEIVRARHAAMYLIREHTELSYPQIGRLFNRHHTSVLHGVASIEGARRVNRKLDELLAS